MKVTAFILIFFCSLLQVNARGQFYTIQVRDIDFPELIKVLEKKTGYSFLFAKADVAYDKKITLVLENASLDVILTQALSPLRLSYQIKEKTIVLSRRNEQKELVLGAMEGKEEIIKGIVFDEANNPLAGAEIRWKDATGTVLTGPDGRFTIRSKNGLNILLVSYVGYEQKELAPESGRTNSIRLIPARSELDRVEIIAYGTTTRRLSTGNTASIKAADIEKQPVSNPLLALQGRVPGLLITQASGTPGSTVTVRIQGTNSLLGSNEPFYVVDGVPFLSSMPAGTGNATVWGQSASAPGNPSSYTATLEAPGAGNPFNYLNPSDIESIEILKDADATAIYGSRAGNGAILITTKKGRVGALSVDINVRTGWEKMTRRVKLLNTTQYLAMRREGYRNSNQAVGQFDWDLNGTYDTSRYTDWQEEFFGKSASYFNSQVNVSGGNSNTNYVLGLGFSRQGTMFPSDFSDKKVSGHFSLRSTSANQRFKMVLSTNYLVDNNQLPAVNLTTNLLYMPPNAPSVLNADGTTNWAVDGLGISAWFGGNPLAGLSNRFNSDVNNLISSLNLSYSILPGLDIKTSGGFTYLNSNQISTSPLSAIPPLDRPNSNRSATFLYNTVKTYIVEPQITYRSNWGGHRFEGLIGGTLQQNDNVSRGVKGDGQTSDAQLFNLSASKIITALSDMQSIYRYNAGFGRLTYNYSDKYIVNLTVRRDGSTRFGPNSRFHNFGAAGLAWVLSKEKFIYLPAFVDFLKFKLSYGSTGNDKVGDYSYMDLYGPYLVNVPYQDVPALATTSLVNNSLQWELTKKLNVGMDLGLFKDRLLIGLNFGRNRSSNLLQRFTLPYLAGFNSVLMNFPGTVQNTSLEFTASGNIVESKSFAWSANFNFTVARNKLVSFPSLDKLISAGAFNYVVGQPLGSFWVYKYLGVDPQTGVMVVEDSKGNPTTSPVPGSEDAKVLMNLTPTFYGGLSQNFSYKGIRLDFMFQFVKQMKQRYIQASTNLPAGFPGYNQPMIVLDRWQKPGDLTTIPKFQAAGTTPLLERSDRNYEDASFLRLKNVSLSLDMPSKWREQIKLRSFRFLLQVQNLLTITRYSGLDPESGLTSMPPYRTIALGLQVGL